MQCGSCFEEIPDDSIFCPECGARQEMSRAGGLPGIGGVGLGGQDVSGGRNFGVVSGEAVMNQNMPGLPNQGMPPGMMPDIMSQIAPTLPGQMPPPSNVTPLPNQMPPNIGGSRGDMPPAAKGPSLASGIGPNTQVGDVASQVGGTAVSNNPSLSPTDAMVNRIAEAERAVKNERRSQWLQMNQQSAANVLSSIGGELPSHLKGQDETSTAEFLANAIGSGKEDSGNDALYKRMAEVAVRRVARKRGVAVDSPQTKSEDGILTVNITYIDDGRVLDTPEDLSSAFEHAISTEVALKGLDAIVEINLFRSKDGEINKIGAESESTEEESDEEMFACEVCDGLVKESDSVCPHCGAVFEEEDDEPMVGGPPARGGPPGPSRGGGPRVHLVAAVQVARQSVVALPAVVLQVHLVAAVQVARQSVVALPAVVLQVHLVVAVPAAHQSVVALPVVVLQAVAPAAHQNVVVHLVAVLPVALQSVVAHLVVVLQVAVPAAHQSVVVLLAAVLPVARPNVEAHQGPSVVLQSEN